MFDELPVPRLGSTGATALQNTYPSPSAPGGWSVILGLAPTTLVWLLFGLITAVVGLVLACRAGNTGPASLDAVADVVTGPAVAVTGG